MVVHRDIGARDLHNRSRHLDVGARGGRIARGMVVHQDDGVQPSLRNSAAHREDRVAAAAHGSFWHIADFTQCPLFGRKLAQSRHRIKVAHPVIFPDDAPYPSFEKNPLQFHHRPATLFPT
jgi:hypothetical protein